MIRQGRKNGNKVVPGCEIEQVIETNMCYKPEEVQPEPVLDACEVGCNHHDDCDVRIKESSIDFLDHTVANVSHFPADWFEVYEPRSDKESKGSRLPNEKKRQGR
jgi:hypothetical protein